MKHLEVSKYEPDIALHGGDDGLQLIRDLLRDAPHVLRPNGLMLLEIGYQQGASTRELAQQAFPNSEVRIEQDYSGHDRIVRIQRNE